MNSRITKLKPGEIFVFGSNLAGRHGAGAAKTAHDKFGAEYGVGEGLTGQCYAFPTKDADLRPLGHTRLMHSAVVFHFCTQMNPHLKFHLTKVGCGLAGFPEEYMKQFFVDMPPNVIKPEGW